MKSCLRPFVLIMLLLRVSYAHAHEAPENSASIIQHDRSVELRLSVDLIGYLERLVPIPMPLDHAADIQPRLALALANLQTTRLLFNKKPLPLNLVRFPDAAEAADTHGHHFTSIVLRAELPKNAQGDLALHLPAELGPVIMNYSKPQTIWVQPNSAGVFHVATEDSVGRFSMSRLAFSVLLPLSLAAYLIHNRRRRDVG